MAECACFLPFLLVGMVGRPLAAISGSKCAWPEAGRRCFPLSSAVPWVPPSPLWHPSTASHSNQTHLVEYITADLIRLWPPNRGDPGMTGPIVPQGYRTGPSSPSLSTIWNTTKSLTKGSDCLLLYNTRIHKVATSYTPHPSGCPPRRPRESAHTHRATRCSPWHASQATDSSPLP